MRKGDVSPGGDQADRVVAQSLTLGAKQLIELTHFGQTTDMGCDTTEPRLGRGRIVDRERDEQLIVLVEASQDIALDVINLQQSFVLGGRRGLARRPGPPRRL